MYFYYFWNFQKATIIATIGLPITVVRRSIQCQERRDVVVLVSVVSVVDFVEKKERWSDELLNIGKPRVLTLTACRGILRAMAPEEGTTRVADDMPHDDWVLSFTNLNPRIIRVEKNLTICRMMIDRIEYVYFGGSIKTEDT